MITESDKTHTALHAPGANLDYSFDWSAWLEEGETVTDSQWSATSGITLSRNQINDGSVTSTYAGGGVLNQTYILTNTITTSSGRIDSRIIRLKCVIR